MKKLIKKASPEQIKTLVDVTLNIMNKNLPANKKAIEFIKAKRCSIRHILHPKYSLASKRRYLIQKGCGIFSPLMAFFRNIGPRLGATAGRIGASAARLGVRASAAA